MKCSAASAWKYVHNVSKLPIADWALAVQAICVLLALAANAQVAARDKSVAARVLVADDARYVFFLNHGRRSFMNGRGISDGLISCLCLWHRRQQLF
jgi:hypothetical protein